MFNIFKKDKLTMTLRYFDSNQLLTSEMIIEGNKHDIEELMYDYIKKERSKDQIKSQLKPNVKLLKG